MSSNEDPPTTSPPPAQQQEPDRISKLMDYLNDPTMDDLPDELKFKYKDGWNPDHLEEELQNHPFFATEIDHSKPLPPLLDAFQQLKYSETDNTPHELACNHKEDGMYHFKIKKYRIASTCFTSAISHELKDPDPDSKFVAQLYNNRSACMWFIQNYRSCANDCQEALKHWPGYFKAFKRGVMALCELERWDEVERMCVGWEGDVEEEKKFVMEMRVSARKGMARVRADERRGVVAEKEVARWKNKIMKAIRDRGIRLGQEGFLEGDAAKDGRVVSFGEDGGLRWPVLILYPQYSTSDFVEAFSEGDSFSLHLSEILDGDNAPSWDVDKEYRSDNVEVYYLCSKLVRVDLQDTLLSVMKRDSYVVPGNGVPSFFVLAKGNGFCEDFKERVQIE